MELRQQYPDLDDNALMKKVSRECYPFGEREYWPYKAWLKAVKDYRRKLASGPPAVQGKLLPLFE